MSASDLAGAMGIPAASVTRLFAGDVTPHVSGRVGTMSMNVQAFINGDVKPGMAQALGMTLPAAQELRNSLDRKGAVGLVMGLTLASAKKERAERRATAKVAAVAADASLGGLDDILP